jgi:hypothetical protein
LDVSCAVTETEQLACWGSDEGYGLGNGDATGDQIAPQFPQLPPDFSANVVGVGLGNGCVSSDFLKQTLCWGSLLNGKSSPTLVEGIAGTTMLAGGFDAACGVSNGTVYCWSPAHGLAPTAIAF